uniref:Chibby 1, beta catenin antagonist n=1 Tax=Felis catus TaxID=9685 RepID=A0ABI7YI27_FELCA
REPLQAVSGRYLAAFCPWLLGRDCSEPGVAPGPEEGWDARACSRGPGASPPLERPEGAAQGAEAGFIPGRSPHFSERVSSLDRSTREVELGLDYGTPTMNLAGQSLKFENGQWIAEMGISGGVDRREAQRLRRRNQQLEEENNLLRLKVDILLDMLSETTAESHLMEKELEELKSTSRRRK